MHGRVAGKWESGPVMFVSSGLMIEKSTTSWWRYLKIGVEMREK
jgi:hypothetical protein